MSKTYKRASIRGTTNSGGKKLVKAALQNVRTATRTVKKPMVKPQKAKRTSGRASGRASGKAGR